MSSQKFTIAVAGTSQHTLQCAQSLLNDPRFTISWILTPSPKPIGRKQIITKNPVHQFAQEHEIPTILVEKKIDKEIQAQIFEQSTVVDFLLVVDFGYLIPQWLLDYPKIAPLNIHPSALPKYRGSSPGQFTLLFGESESAVTLMRMDKGLDTGNLINQYFFKVLNTWKSAEFYTHAFDLITTELPNAIAEYGSKSENERHNFEKPQPETSPTPIARRLSREDGFLPWEFLHTLMVNSEPHTTELEQLSDLLHFSFEKSQSWQKTIEQATRAFSPWPGVWTIVPTVKGEKRMKILSVSIIENNLQLDTVQLEGLQPTPFSQVKNQIV